MLSNFPQNYRSTNVHIQASNNAKLGNFYAFVHQIDDFHWHSVLFIAQNQNCLVHWTVGFKGNAI